ncbi:sigma-54-dependent transcriptional regulator [Anaeromyxobacter diazotrophicus]|uniref:Acetoacetate metabolism regulatory protein AtoC n=1 Tax=Anaeromyxobacter diazotrophicus TaxID=2590199 RepID=A0A7I9VNN2_9BACT|nr:sigma-54 dependent transcriptional regulator [Anaeromyxobacter diazotrophicus]GEJ57808.1 acetoacetate metabolism regulatory protein AtoC [Anaeromyxobacter diazotrophicus]
MSPPAKILVIDDEKTFRVVAQAALAAEGFEARSAASAGEGLALARELRPEVVVLDRNLPDADGLAVLERLRADGHGDEPLVVMATAYGEIENAVQAVKLGAFDYLTKPIQLPALVLTVKRALEARRLRRRADGFSGTARRRVERGLCLGESAAMRRVVELAEKVAASPDTTVLIEGESGTGKELVARLLHLRTAQRSEAPFVELNCAAIPETLLEAELFGHERGAFTDAKRAKPGLLEQAEGGTVFLDEVGDMPLATQAKLLKVLETQVFRRLGGTRDLGADVRFVSATHRDLQAAVADGGFRLDLFHRLDVFHIHIPPLRERPEDVLPLARFFLAELASRAGKEIRGLAPETERRLLAYPFPGNVRELRNVVERGVILETGDTLSPEAVLLRDEARPRPDAPAPPEAGEPPTLEEMERAYLAGLLDRAKGNRSQVARWMGVSYPTVLKKIADYGIDLSRWD